jgi:hypothetical protein
MSVLRSAVIVIVLALVCVNLVSCQYSYAEREALERRQAARYENSNADLDRDNGLQRDVHDNEGLKGCADNQVYVQGLGCQYCPAGEGPISASRYSGQDYYSRTARRPTTGSDASASSPCRPCKIGSFSLNGGCERCAKGTFQDVAGSTSCRKCPTNTWADDEARSVPCLPCPSWNGKQSRSKAGSTSCELVASTNHAQANEPLPRGLKLVRPAKPEVELDEAQLDEAQGFDEAAVDETTVDESAQVDDAKSATNNNDIKKAFHGRRKNHRSGRVNVQVDVNAN